MGILLIVGIILFILWLLLLFVFSLGALIHIAACYRSHSYNYLAAESSVRAILAIQAFK